MKMVSTVVAAVAMLAAAGTASAQSFSPSSGSFSGSGAVEMYNSAYVTCNASISGTVASSSLANITSKSFSPAPSITCGWAVTPYGAWSVQTIPGNYSQVKIYLGANTIIGNPCHGWVIADVVNVGGGNSEIHFDNDELISDTSGPTGCFVVSGYITANLTVI